MSGTVVLDLNLWNLYREFTVRSKNSGFGRAFLTYACRRGL